MRTKLSVFCEGLIEAGWLLVLILAPLYFNVYSSRVFEPDKTSVVRSIALVMAAAWLVKTLDAGVPETHQLAVRMDQPSLTLSGRLRRGFLSTPLVLPTLLLVVAYLVSTVLSVAPRISLWGSYVRLQGTYTTLSYILIFFLVLVTLRRQEQIDRLVSTAILTSVPVSLYGVLQHYGLDSLPWSGDVITRVAANMGNSIFVAAYLIMVVPLTLARLVEAFSALLKDDSESISHALLAGCYTFVLSVQVICILFTQSRGPLLGLLAGLYVFVLVGLISLRRSIRDQQALGARDAVRALAFALLSLPTGVVPAYIALVALKRGLRWLWLSWVIHTVLLGLFLVLFNVPNTPLASLRELPYIGRMGRVFETEAGTGKVRVLIWEGALKLITADPLRALVGYGPETMHVAYNPYYPPELAYYEARNASPDRSHNETLDSLVITGLFGFVAYMSLFVSIFYFGLRWLGFMQSERQRNLFLLLSAGGAAIGTLLPRLLQGTFVLSGVGLPVGFVIGTSIYLMVAAAFFYGHEWPAIDLRRQLLLIGLLSAVVAHFVEIHFGIAIVSTRTHFWVYAALFVLLGLDRVIEGSQAEAGSVADGVESGYALADAYSRRHGKRKARGDRQRVRVPVSAPAVDSAARLPQLTTRLIASSLVVAVILFVLGFEFVANAMKEFDILRIIELSLTTTAARGDPKTSYGTLWLFVLTWLVGGLVALADSERTSDSRQKASWWLSGLGIYFLCTWGVFVVGIVVHASRILPYVDVAGTVNSFYVLISVLGLLLTAAIVSGSSLPARWWRAANLWMYPLAFLAAGLVAFASNVSPVKADIYYKTGLKLEEEANGYLTSAKRLESQGDMAEVSTMLEGAAWRLERSSQFYDRAISLAQDQDYYYLFLGRTLMSKASTVSDVLEKARWFEESYQALDRARQLNPLNTDHYANLGRLYRNWADLSDSPEDRTARLEQANEYYAHALGLSPHNVQLLNEWALVYAASEDYERAFQKLDDSSALDPRYDATYLIYAQLYRQLGRDEDTIRVLQQAVDYNPENVEAHSWLGYVYAQQGRLEEATAANRAILNLAPDDQISHRNLAILYQQLERTDESTAHWQAYQLLETLAADPDSAASHRDLALQYQQLGLIKAAIAHVQRAVELSTVEEWPVLRSLLDELNAQIQAEP